MRLNNEFVAMGRYDANSFLDTIGYGHLALSFVFVCYELIRSSAKTSKWLLLIPLLFGLVSIGIANSRGPIVAFLITIIFVLLTKAKFKDVIILTFISLIFILNLDLVNLFFKEYFDNNFIERFMTIFEYGMDSSSGRTEFYEQGIELFKENPLFGRSILLIHDPLKGGYVHNVFIEILMSTGLVGMIIFALILIKTFQYSIYLMVKNSQYCIFVLIFVQNFILLQFSRSLNMLPVFWISMACVCSTYILEKNRK
jgi:oligosaccharide repeat unit polymerase